MYKKYLPKPTTEPIDQGSLLAFNFYKTMLEEKGVQSVNHTEIPNGDPTNPEHLLWMCNFCIPRVRDDGLGMAEGKYSRWLGFIQGCLICHGWTTVEAERNRTRPWFNKKG